MSKTDFTALIKKAKETKVTTPVQKVIPVQKEKVKETPFSVHLPSEMLKQLKLMAVEKETSIKNLIITALSEQYFK